MLSEDSFLTIIMLSEKKDKALKFNILKQLRLQKQTIQIFWC